MEEGDFNRDHLFEISKNTSCVTRLCPPINHHWWQESKRYYKRNCKVNKHCDAEKLRFSWMKLEVLKGAYNKWS